MAILTDFTFFNEKTHGEIQKVAPDKWIAWELAYEAGTRTGDLFQGSPFEHKTSM